MRINNANSDFLNIISVSFKDNRFINDLFHVIEIANAHNFVDDNALTAFANNIHNLIHLLESESNVAIKWFKNNKMIVNPGNKEKTNHTQEKNKN